MELLAAMDTVNSSKLITEPGQGVEDPDTTQHKHQCDHTAWETCTQSHNKADTLGLAKPNSTRAAIFTVARAATLAVEVSSLLPVLWYQELISQKRSLNQKVRSNSLKLRPHLNLNI